MKLDFFDEVFNKPGSRNIRLALSLLLITIVTAVVIFLFEAAKMLVAPGITLWQSHICTIIFMCIISPLIALLVMLKFEKIYETIARENEERKRAEDTLRESEEKFRVLAEMSSAVIYVYQGEYLVYVNDAAQRITGYSRDDFLKMKFWDIVHPDFKDQVKERGLAEQRGEPVPSSLEVEFITKSGETRWAEVTAGRIMYMGKPAGVATFFDITERKRVEDALRESEGKYRNIVENVNDIVWQMDEKFIFTYISPQIFNAWGYTPEEVVGKTPMDFMTPDEAERVSKILEDVAGKRDKLLMYENRHLRKDGRIMYLEVSGQPIIDKNGVYRGYRGVLRDITERKHADIDLQEAKDQAEMYLDLMSHDINNMNQIAIGFLELAQEASTLEDAKNLISRPLESLHSSSKLIENVSKLQKSRLESLKLESLKHHIVDLCDVLLNLQKRYTLLPGRDIEIDFVPVPGCLVIANDLIEDVFSNLISNSIKHSEADKPLKIHLGVSIVGEDGNRYYKVIVEDNGPGIPDPMKARLFLRFQRGTTKASGKGLGLYLVKTLVDDFNGKVRVEDRIPGDHTQGVRFEVLIPALE